MALNPKTIQFFIDRITNATSNTIQGAIKQLFEHLSNEVKDNPVYDKFEAGAVEYKDWPRSRTEAILPGSFEDAKKVAYGLYHRFANFKDANLFNFLLNTGMDIRNDLPSALRAFNNMYLSYFVKAIEDIIAANPEIDTGAVEKVEGTRVFIIHGHDELIKKDLQLLLERAGVNYLVLHEQPDKGRNIIDKLIEESKDSNYAIGLLTPDDTSNGMTRARQNVILEIGYFLGKLGKERVRMLVKDNIEMPSDLTGILYEKHDPAGAWKTKILKEMMAVGIYVDLKTVVEKA